MRYTLQRMASRLFWLRSPAIGLCVLGLAAVTSVHAESPTIRLGFQPWPGVTVKTEIASQILETLGYRTEQKQLGTTVILQGIAKDDIDLNLGIWYPLFKQKFDPFVENNEVRKLYTNLPGTRTAVAVPEYVHEAGISSVTDLQKYPERFNRTIYGIESGAAWNNHIEKTIKGGKYGLGDWKMVPSSTSGMLAQVERSISRKDWIVFHSWEPHWMRAKFDLYYLTAPEDSPIRQRHGSVYTVARPDFPKKQPNVAKLFRQFRVSADTQNGWILQFEYKDRPKDEVAREWISANLDRVESWLEGVTMADGRDNAFAAVKAEYGN